MKSLQKWPLLLSNRTLALVFLQLYINFRSRKAYQYFAAGTHSLPPFSEIPKTDNTRTDWPIVATLSGFNIIIVALAAVLLYRFRRKCKTRSRMYFSSLCSKSFKLLVLLINVYFWKTDQLCFIKNNCLA